MKSIMMWNSAARGVSLHGGKSVLRMSSAGRPDIHGWNPIMMVLPLRYMTTTSSRRLTGEEAGKQAAILVASKLKNTNMGHPKHNNNGPHQLQLSTILSHAGIEVEMGEDNTKIGNIPMAPPLHTATTYTRPADGIYKTGYVLYKNVWQGVLV
jgi:hypothetical protein